MSATLRVRVAQSGAGRSRVASVWWASAALATLLSLYIRAQVPPLIYVDGKYDDLLFTNSAHHLLNGQWLGPFDGNVTLSKGIGYPAFLAASHIARLPYLLAQQGLHLLAAAAIALAVFRLTRSRPLGFTLYAVIALDPTYFGTLASRPIRDSFYASICLLLLAVFSWPLLRRPGARTGIRFLSEGAWGGLAGVLFALYWLTREERPWLLPALLLLILPSCLRELRAVRGSTRLEQHHFTAPFVFLVTIGLLVGGVMLTNDRKYGVALTNDITEGAFAGAFGQWQTVRSGPVKPYVPITHEMRRAVFNVSAAARELQPFLEGGYERGWTDPGCQAIKVCDDVAGGWTQWMLRAALDSTGKYETAPAIQEFWSRLDREIQDACRNGHLRCGARTPFLLPQPENLNVDRYATSFVTALNWVVNVRLADQLAMHSAGDPVAWPTFHDTLVGLPADMSAHVVQARGFDGSHSAAAVVTGAYRLLSAPLLLLALAGYAWSLLRRRRVAVHLLAAALFTGIACRIGFLALVDSTAFPAVKSIYLLPASTFLIPFTALGVWSFLNMIVPGGAARLESSQTQALGQTDSHRDDSALEISVVLPCLNEALTLGTCIDKARDSLDRLGTTYEIVVADNGSTDGSQRIAVDAGARVVEIPTRGYGAALRGGIAAARGRYVLMADADDSYALDDIAPFLDALREGNDLVMGNRFLGGIRDGAMPKLHRYLGNPVLSWIGRRFFKIPVGDFHCGMRAFDREKALALGLRSDGMEFASELVVKFALTNQQISEVPTVLSPDGRDRAPHLRSWRDGWRHLRFLLLFSPRWLFLYPGSLLAALGALLCTRLAFGPVAVGPAVLDAQSLLFAGASVVIGTQSILFAVLGRSYAAARGILPNSRLLEGTQHPLALERGAIAGGVLLFLGLIGSSWSFVTWINHGFGPLVLHDAMRLAVPSVTLLSVGAELLMASFFLGLLQLDEQISPTAPMLASPQAVNDKEQ